MSGRHVVRRGGRDRAAQAFGFGQSAVLHALHWRGEARVHRGHPRSAGMTCCANSSTERVNSAGVRSPNANRSEEHTSELQSHSFISYAVFCLKKKNDTP